MKRTPVKRGRVKPREVTAPDPRYAGLTFYDPQAPRPVAPAVVEREYGVDPVPPERLAQLWRDTVPPEQPPVPAPEIFENGMCAVCRVIVDMKLKLPHMWWCPWWDSVEGRAHPLPF